MTNLASRNNHYDAIIIGAGIGGLTAACLLSKSGKKVLVLERNAYPGGLCSNFKRGDYTFESAIHAINGAYEGGRIDKILKKCGIRSNISFLEHEYSFGAVFPDEVIRVPKRSMRAFMNQLIERYPGESDGLNELYNEMSELFNESANFGNSRNVSTQISLAWRYRDTTLYEYLNNKFVNKKLISIISQYWGYLGVPPKLLSTINYLYMLWDYVENGAFYPRGGSEGVAKMLADSIAIAGSDIMYGCEVVEMDHSDERIVSVKLANGNFYEADYYVSNVSPAILHNKLIRRPVDTNSTPDNVESNTPSLSAFVVYLGLNVNLRDLGFHDYELFLNPSYNDSEMYSANEDNDFAKTQLSLTAYSNLDDTMCPVNKSVVSIFSLANYSAWARLTKDEYHKKRTESLEQILERVESIIPRLRNYIEIVEIATPVTLERYSNNPCGAIYGSLQTIKNSSYMRQSNSTIYSNLVLAGAWTRPGGGFSSVMYSGLKAAQSVLGLPIIE